jgi:hypothetical protein
MEFFIDTANVKEIKGAHIATIPYSVIIIKHRGEYADIRI